MLRDTNGVERKKEGARTQQPVTHTSVARCWVLRPFLGLRVVCAMASVHVFTHIPLSLPLGGKKSTAKVAGPLSKRAAARHALPRGASDSGASGACAGQLFSASRATAREIRPERRGAGSIGF